MLALARDGGAPRGCVGGVLSVAIVDEKMEKVVSCSPRLPLLLLG